MIDQNEKPPHTNLNSSGQSCILCDAHSEPILLDSITARLYLRCHACNLHYVRCSDRPSLEEERRHYDLHNNDITDPRYQEFVKPLYDHIELHLKPDGECLDYGSGPGPVLAEMLKQNGVSVECYDPYYSPDIALLDRQYDVVFACEVVEHFFSPLAEFEKLSQLVKPGGALILQTSLTHTNIDFENWYYRRDPTHVVFYSSQTLTWIKWRFGFEKLKIDGHRIAIFEQSVDLAQNT